MADHRHAAELRRIERLSDLLATEGDPVRRARLERDLRKRVADLYTIPVEAVPGARGLARFAC